MNCIIVYHCYVEPNQVGLGPTIMGMHAVDMVFQSRMNRNVGSKHIAATCLSIFIKAIWGLMNQNQRVQTTQWTQWTT
jgi:hypothetical protein